MLINSMERELQQKLSELDTARREAHSLNKQMLGMTPRKQDGTPRQVRGANDSLNFLKFKWMLKDLSGYLALGVYLRLFIVFKKIN